MFKIQKINQKATAPQRATDGSAGYDLCACLENEITINSGEIVLIPTGLCIELPKNTAGMIYARSGLATKHGIALANSVGVVDWDYRGEVKIALINLSKNTYKINNGDRIAQLVLTPVVCPNVIWADNLNETERGAGGFGSTGINKN
ncbi:MAG: dUTP diphosphatase [Clostridia bacterium]